jgi:DnaK suppressor protein
MCASGTSEPDPKSSDSKDEELRNTLIKLREKIVKDAQDELSKYIKGKDRQEICDVLDTGDWSVYELAEGIKLKALESHRQTIIKVDESINKLAEHTYGLCDDCNEEISPGRLKVLPFATRCRDCQEIEEDREASESDSKRFKL